MTDREVELTILVDKAKAEVADGLTNCSETENIVKHLLANGVIVPPCKVGDTVYFYKAELNEICPARVIEIHNKCYTPSMPLWITIQYESDSIGTQEITIANDVFKLVCFKTKEEAERALKELNK